jgi:glucans biosynthesis protein C
MVDAIERRPLLLYAVTLPSLAANWVLAPHWPTTHNLTADWANLTSCFLTFLWGFVIASVRRFLGLITRRRRELLSVGIALAVAFFALRETEVRSRAIWEPLSAYFGMSWMMALVGYARHAIRSGGPKLAYVTDAVYPFYIVHQTVTIAVGYYVIQLPWGVWPKFAVVAVATFLGSWICYELVRRTVVTRVLFGLRPRPRTAN